MRMYDMISEVTSRVTGWGGSSKSSKEFEEVCITQSSKILAMMKILTSILVGKRTAETCCGLRKSTRGVISEGYGRGKDLSGVCLVGKQGDVRPRH